MSDPSAFDPHSPPKSAADKPVRSMADIAKLFLDGARPAAPTGAPRRMSPKDRASGTTPAPSPVAASAQPVRTPVPTVLLAVSGNNLWPAAAAAKLAQENNTTACIIGIQNADLVFQLVGPKAAERIGALRALTAAGAASMLDLQIARALFTIQDAVSLFLIAAPATDSAPFRALAKAMRHWLLICPTDNDAVVSTYQTFKRAAAAASERPAVSAFMLDDDYAVAAVVHSRLQRAAREFLQADLPLAGVGNAAPSTSFLATFPIRGRHDLVWSTLIDELLTPPVEESLPTPIAPAPAPRAPEPRHDVDTILDEVDDQLTGLSQSSIRAAEQMIDTLTHVLDPEEKAALAAALDTIDEPEPEPVAQISAPTPAPRAPDVRSHVLEPVTVQVPAAPSLASAQPLDKLDSPALRAFEFEPQHSARHAQFLAIERSIRDLVPHSILLDARPPMSWASECVVAVAPEGKDRAGPCRLHVWTLYKDGVTWFALREWAHEHRNLLALTRRDLTLSRDAEVAVHIVLPLEADKALDATTLLRTPVKNVHLYRLRAIQWANRQGILVVPIA